MKRMSYIMAVFAVAALVATASFNALSADAFGDNWKNATQARQKRDFAKAVEFASTAEKCATSDNAKADCIALRFYILVDQGNLAQANKELAGMLKLKGNELKKFQMLIKLGNTALQGSDFPAALRYASQAETFAANDAQKSDCLMLKLSAYLKQRNTAKAQETGKGILALNCPIGVKRNAISNFVKHLVENKDFVTAQKMIDMLEQAPDPKNEITADICFLRYDICKAAGDEKGMEAGFDKILTKKCPDNKKFNYARNVSEYYKQSKKFKELATFSERAAKALPESVAGGILRYQAWAYESLKDRAAEEKILLAIVANEKYDWHTRLDAAGRLCKAFYRSKEMRSAGMDVIAKLHSAKVDDKRLTLEADYLFELEEDAAALAVFDNALKTPNLTDMEKSFIIYAKARLLQKQTKYIEAARAYQTAYVLGKGTNHWAKRGMFECNVKENHINEALANLERVCLMFAGKDPMAKAKAYIELINSAISVGEFQRARKYLAQLNAIGNLPPSVMPDAQYMPFAIAFAENNLILAEQEFDKLAAMKHGRTSEAALQLGTRYFERRQLAKAVKCYNFVPGSCMKQNWRIWDQMQNILVAYSLAGQEKAMKEKAMDFADNSTLNADMKAICRITATGKAFSAKELQLNNEQYADVLAKAAKLQVRFGNEAKARELFAVRARLFAPAKQNRLTIKYVQNAPSDVGAWQHSALLRDKSNRANVTTLFGANEAAFLVTDVMAANRKVGDSSIQADKETYFYMCYDEYGIHLYFVGVDSKVKDVMSGKIGGSGYEMYIALGENGPSYQWLFDQPNDTKLDIPPWSSPNKYYRHLRDYITITSRPVENGIATAMNFSWDLAYDRLPANGDMWPFEIIRWTRGGGVTWGGKFVWEIGHWGRIQFTGLTPDVMDKIRTIIIFKALKRYNAQKQPRTGGKVAIWQDQEIGDPAFYNQVLKAEVERLDGLAKLATDKMDRATIEKLWVEAVPYWFDFTYHVAELRRQYLQNRFIETGK